MGCGGSTAIAPDAESTSAMLAALVRRVEAAEAAHQTSAVEAAALRAQVAAIALKLASVDAAANEAASLMLAQCHAPLPPPETEPPTDDQRLRRQITYDAFLSHKRTDSADFARVLNTELTNTAGLKCFLDQDSDFQLGDLMSKVRASKVLIFILSDHILESQWCALELREALLWGVEVILLTAHGASWTIEGRTHDFPPPCLIRPELTAAFENKAIEYNRSAHGVVIDQILQRINGKPVRAAVAKWEIEAQDNGTSLVSVQLARSKWRINLPPNNKLQTFDGIGSWLAASPSHSFTCAPLDHLRAVDDPHQRMPLRRMGAYPLCNVCNVDVAESQCRDCSARHCVPCSREIHEDPEKANHNRSQLGKSNFPCAICNTPNAAVRCGVCRIGLCHKCTCDRRKVFVPTPPSDKPSARPVSAAARSRPASAAVRSNTPRAVVVVQPVSPPQEDETSSSVDFDAISGYAMLAETSARESVCFFSVLLLDGPVHSVQTGRLSFDHMLRFVDGVAYWKSHQHHFSAPFRPGTRPEVFVALSGYAPLKGRGASLPQVAQLALRAHQVHEKGFALSIGCTGPSFLSAQGQLEVAEMSAQISVSWLAFDPRLNRSWTHGEIWLTEDPKKKTLFRQVHFLTDAVSSSGGTQVREPFSLPPLVYLSVGGLVCAGGGLDFNLEVRENTTFGFGLVVRLRHPPAAEQSIAAQLAAELSSAEDGTAQSPPAASRPLTRVCVRWLALPYNVDLSQLPYRSALASSPPLLLSGSDSESAPPPTSLPLMRSHSEPLAH